RFEEREKISLFLLSQDAIDKVVFVGDVRPQFPHHRITAANFLRCIGNLYARAGHVVGFVSRLPSYQICRPSRERAAPGPRRRTGSVLPKISPAEYIRSLRREVTTGSDKILKRPIFRSAMLK